MSMWIAVAGVGLGSFALRLLPLLVLGRIELGPRSEELIGRGGLAAIAALVAVSAQSAAQGQAMPAAVAALATGVVLAARRASMLRIMAIGCIVYAAVRLGSGVW
jgi:branched-subunit amino acid transport protein